MNGRMRTAVVRSARFAVCLAAGLLLVVGLTLTETAPAVPSAAAAPQGAPLVYMPLIRNHGYKYLPFVSLALYQPVNLANGSFEADTVIDYSKLPKSPCIYNGFTDQPKGNQHPSGWTFYSPAQGQLMPFPTKMQQGTVVPAISGGPGEYVHKCWWQLPDDERLGQPRGLILDGDWTYKAFNSGTPQALQLSQILTGTPGLRMEVTGYILGETPDKPCHSCSKLEDDHFIGSVQLGSVADTRFYATMIKHFDVPGNQRNWNKYDLSSVIPPSGQLRLTIIMQQNWSGETNFFIDNFQALQWFTQ